MKYLSATLLLFFFIGCAASGRTSPPSDPLERLRYDIDAVLADSIFIPARASIKVVSLDTKEMFYERDSKVLMRPASNMKLLTSSTALYVLGKDYVFKTVVFADTAVVNGTLFGNIYLKGFGDPDLKTEDLDSLAEQVRMSGINSIVGDIMGDVTYFDDEYWGSGWMWDDEPFSDEMFITPLSVNSNCVKVKAEPGYFAGDSVRVTIDPQTSYVLLVNFARTVSDTVLQPLKITRLYKERSNVIVVDGQMLVNSPPHEEQLSVWKPELYTTQLFKEALLRRGIAHQGQVKIGMVPSYAKERAVHIQRIDSMVVHLNKVSANLSAENTLKTIASLKRGVPGKAQNGVYVVNEFLALLGIDTTAYLMVDGSGVSHYNLLSAEVICQLLVAMYHRYDIFPLFYESLPVAGVDGTLRGRMKATVAESNVRAKTGTISGVSSLSGYVRTRDGETLVFSMMMQNFILPSRLYRDAQDKIATLLARFSRRRISEVPTP